MGQGGLTSTKEEIRKLREILEGGKRMVFFGGAGVSTESGIPDFRSVDGLYSMKYDYPPEEIISHTFFMRHTAEFYRFYRDKLLFLDAKPNAAHFALARLESEGKLAAVVTQNVDGLHTLAGSKKVLELHGCVHRNFCMKCRKAYGVEAILGAISAGDGIPRCTCGGIIKPDVVLYEEALDDGIMEEAVRYIAAADVLIIGGTSLVVYPAAGLIRYFHGKHLVLINKSELTVAGKAELTIRDGIGATFAAVEALEA
ncbi:MAG: NAD-dependent protein deacylase [Lachnospiraceae bacterium]|jgi:NAD-dependent deacetylase|nr:NAD-dependent protein deacylase [Lachnospiraceae bacterium]